jgi:hypothetical protein
MENPTATPTTAPEPGSATHRLSVIEANVVAMRSSALALVEMGKAFAVQCDTLLLTLSVVGPRSGQAAPPSPTRAAAQRRTFGPKAGAPDREDAVEDVGGGHTAGTENELLDRVRSTSGGNDGG